MRMIDLSANRFLPMSCDIVGKCRLFFITRRVSAGFTEYPSLTRRVMNNPVYVPTADAAGPPSEPQALAVGL
ncbi:hypothetical protein Pla52n_46850 [Stieleria varia]|uniref:Uncharacterized protein n=1 Tax=Stieleria varia TaxID=2528005 RepID=A0A5C6APG1_9BACT|nr:hypothetical protein Pla52n_46850 [Stieleria varia]